MQFYLGSEIQIKDGILKREEIDNLMNKLSEIQRKKSIEPKCDFMNNLNMIAI